VGSLIAGVDEAGRGALAGPVVAAAVVWGDTPLEGLADSKRLSPAVRERLYDTIVERALGVGVGVVSHEVIDQINILKATMRAMEWAVAQLPMGPDWVLVDGNRVPASLKPRVTAMVRGDQTVACISAASIVAKVTRDRLMTGLAEGYPVYGFGRHKGYGTKDHYEALRCHGPSPVHRVSFRLH